MSGEREIETDRQLNRQWKHHASREPADSGEGGDPTGQAKRAAAGGGYFVVWQSLCVRKCPPTLRYAANRDDESNNRQRVHDGVVADDPTFERDFLGVVERADDLGCVVGDVDDAGRDLR